MTSDAERELIDPPAVPDQVVAGDHSGGGALCGYQPLKVAEVARRSKEDEHPAGREQVLARLAEEAVMARHPSLVGAGSNGSRIRAHRQSKIWSPRPSARPAAQASVSQRRICWISSSERVGTNCSALLLGADRLLDSAPAGSPWAPGRRSTTQSPDVRRGWLLFGKPIQPDDSSTPLTVSGAPRIVDRSTGLDKPVA